MKAYMINIYWKDIEVIQNDDWTFQRPSILDEWKWFWTSAKPAHEPICMARKPLEMKTVAENVLKYGTGGINIDESRVGTWDRRMCGTTDKSGETSFVLGAREETRTDIGRFPANLIHDNSEEVRECFPETKSGAMNGTYKGSYDFLNDGIVYGKNANTQNREKSEGNASRFFKSIIYQAKASKSERNKGCEELEEKQYSYDGREKEIENAYQRNKSVAHNNHPTVKPIALMEYLIKMVTKEWWTVLDPFVWSWTTLVAAKKNWYNYIWFELDNHYVDIANKRIQDRL